VAHPFVNCRRARNSSLSALRSRKNSARIIADRYCLLILLSSDSSDYNRARFDARANCQVFDCNS